MQSYTDTMKSTETLCSLSIYTTVRDIVRRRRDFWSSSSVYNFLFPIRDVTLSDNSRILIVKSVGFWFFKRDPFPFFLFMTEEFYARYSYIM